MKRSLLLLLAVAMVSAGTYAQEYVYTLNQYTPLNYNPAAAAYDNDASVSFLSRSTEIAPGVNYQNNVFNGEYPMVTKSGKRYGGIGLNFIQKDAGNSDMLKTHAIGLSLAYNLQILKEQFVSFGLQTTYYNKQTSLENMTTGSQWLAEEFRFDPNASLGEPLSENNISYIGLNAGLTWYLQSKEDHSPRAFFSIAAHNLNQPDESFFTTGNNVPVNYLVNAGAVLYENSVYRFSPQVIYQHESTKNLMSLILSNTIFIRNENPYDIIKSGSVEILGKYDLQRDMSVGAVFHQPAFSVGFSYTFPVSNEAANSYLQGGIEFSLKLSKTIWKVKPKTVVIDNVTPGSSRNIRFDEDKDDRKTVVVQKSDVDIIQENIEELSEVKAVKFELTKDFKFEFGKAELNEAAKVYLDDIYALLQKNPEYKLEVIGHTDNVGKPQLNYKLSTERARVVSDYLEKKGLNEERITYSGKGDTVPLTNNDTEENRSKNRRVQFIIYVDR